MDIRILQHMSNNLWEVFGALFPDIGEYPRVTLSNRLKSTLGYCQQEHRIITLRADMFGVSTRYMVHTILPHELAYQVDYDLNGICEDKGGHGETWEKIMLTYGLEPRRYAHHSMGRIKCTG